MRLEYSRLINLCIGCLELFAQSKTAFTVTAFDVNAQSKSLPKPSSNIVPPACCRSAGGLLVCPQLTSTQHDPSDSGLSSDDMYIYIYNYFPRHKLSTTDTALSPITLR